MKIVKLISFIGAVVFAAVGLVFALIPESVLVFFNNLSGYLDLPQSPVQGAGLYLALAVAFMYLVTVLAFLIFRYPEAKCFPLLLANAKFASSAISLFLFVTGYPYLILITNFIADGIIGAVALLHYFRVRGKACF